MIGGMWDGRGEGRWDMWVGDWLPESEMLVVVMCWKFKGIKERCRNLLLMVFSFGRSRLLALQSKLKLPPIWGHMLKIKIMDWCENCSDILVFKFDKNLITKRTLFYILSYNTKPVLLAPWLCCPSYDQSCLYTLLRPRVLTWLSEVESSGLISAQSLVCVNNFLNISGLGETY